MKIFADAENILRYAERTVLQSGDVHLPATGIDDSQKDALDFLLALNYLEHDETCRGLVPATLNLSTSENRHALLKLASKMNRAFQLPSPHAPGATFFGGTMAAVTFGLAAHGHGSASAGGRGTTFRAAFEGCLGEVAEYISFLQRDNDPLIATGPDHRSDCTTLGQWAVLGGRKTPVLMSLIGLRPDHYLISLPDCCQLDWYFAVHARLPEKRIVPVLVRAPQNIMPYGRLCRKPLSAMPRHFGGMVAWFRGLLMNLSSGKPASAILRRNCAATPSVNSGCWILPAI